MEEFVGEDRGVKRLQLTTVDELPFHRGPVVEIGDSLDAAQRVMAEHGTEWVGTLRDGVFVGWIHEADLAGRRQLSDAPSSPPARVVTPDSTLRNALELIMSSNTAVAVIDDAGRFGGIVTLETIRAGLALDESADDLS